MNADFEGIEVHSRKVFNTVKEKKTTTKQADESVGPMVNSKIAEFFSVCRQRSLKTKHKRTKSHLDFSVLFCSVFCYLFICCLFGMFMNTILGMFSHEMSHIMKRLRLKIQIHHLLLKSSKMIACERQTFLLAHRCWGTFCEEERLWLSDRNSILMTQNLSRIRSEALIGRRSSFIVLAIVYEWQTKDKRSNVNGMNL